MDIVTIDFETYYDKEFSLSKMTTEQYIRDPRFEVIGVGLKVNNNPTDWYSGSNVGGFLRGLDYSDKAILAHHTAFDGAILSWKYGIKPKLWLDTLSMAKAKVGQTQSVSLANLCMAYGLGEKGREVTNALGMRRRDFTPDKLATYGDYCINDVELTYKLFKVLAKGYPSSELAIIDATLRLYTEPMIELDPDKLATHLAHVKDQKATLMQRLAVEGISTEDLMSNNKLAHVLLKYGVPPPTKQSPTTGEMAFAFSKTDKEFTDLLNHEDTTIQNIVAARLGVKSTLDETRTEALIGVQERGPLPVMLNYYGAHTGRFSGGDKLNMQNLPRGGAIRKAMSAPDGYVFCVVDSAQIEARVLAWLAGEEHLLDAFRNKRDVYSEFASKLYDRPITKADTRQRFVGKVCIAEGTLVLTHKGWKAIETITTDDLLWDGGEWVCHQGLLDNGIKPTLNLCGAWLTPDHLVWSGTQWLEAQSVVADENTLYQVLETGAEKLPSQAMFLDNDAGCAPSSFDVIAARTNTQSKTTLLKPFGLPDATSAQRKHRSKNGIGYTAKQCQTMFTELVYSIAFPLRCLAATTRRTLNLCTTGSAELLYTLSGDPIGQRSYNTSKPLKGGTTPNWKSTGSMWMAIMNRAISGSRHVNTTYKTNERSLISKRVFDILNCGSRNRFTILTADGPVIVHNCILGLGYGLGHAKLQLVLQSGAMGMKVNMSMDEARSTVLKYRDTNHRIKGLWNEAGHALGAMARGGEYILANRFRCHDNKIELPNGMSLQYPMLNVSGNNQYRYCSSAPAYKSIMTGRLAGDNMDDLPWTYIYGGKVIENLVQALATCIIKEQWLRVNSNNKYKVVLQVHDELAALVPRDKADEGLAYMMDVMSTPPEWAKDLPIACEGSAAKFYGDAK